MNKIYSTIMVCLLLLSVKVHAQITLTATGGSPTGSFTTLKAAFDAINLGTHQGVINIRVHGNTIETATCNLDSSGNATASSYTSILIRPADTATVVKSISMSTATILMTLTGADNITFDGRAGGIGATQLLEFNHTAAAATNLTCRLNVGATNNTFMFCRWINASAASTAHNIHLTNTVTATTPNSNNQFLNNFIIGGRNSIVFDAVNAIAPMTNIVIRNNDIFNFGFAGVSALSNLGQIIIDSNSFYHETAFTATGATRAVNIAGAPITVAITAQITKNRIFGFKTSTTSIFGMLITPPSTATTSVFNIVNNSIVFMDANNAVNAGAIGGVTGIAITGAGSAETNIYHNTIRIGGTAVGGTAASLTIRSVGIGKFNSGTSNILRVKNNIVTNTRTGGASTTNAHMAAWINTNTAGVHDINYNTYAGNGFVCGWGGTVYATVAGGYQTAAAPNDANSIQKTPAYANTTQPYLTGASNGDPDLSASPLPGILTDIDNNTRATTICYKGAWESTSQFTTDDLAATIIYTYGRIPVGTDEAIRVRIKNNAVLPATNKTITVMISGANNTSISTFVPNISALADTIIVMPLYSPVQLGIDTVRAIMPFGDQNSANDTIQWIRENTLNSLSYSNVALPRTGNVGNNGVGEIVAKFYSPVANTINQVNVNFTNPGFTVPLSFQLVVYPDSGGTFGPSKVAIFESTTQQTVNGIFNLSLPNVPVNGNFFVGVRQVTTNNIGFAYQAETPIRPNTMYFRQDLGGSLNVALAANWNDFAPNNGFRFMIEPRLQINDDLGVTALMTPNQNCQDTGVKDIIVEVTNLGLLNQNFANDTLRLFGKVTSPTNVITNLGPIVITNGTLNTNISANYTLATNFLFNEVGNYTFTAWTKYNVDLNKVNDTLPDLTRNISIATTAPSNQTFNAALTVPTGWVTNRFFINAGSGTFGTNSARVGLNGLSGFTANAVLQSPRFNNITANSSLRFDYKIIDNFGGTAATLTANDSIKVMISLDCGNTFSQVAVIAAANHVSSTNYVTYTIPLGTFVGNNVMVKIQCDWLNTINDCVVDLDNIRIIDGVNDVGITASSAPCRSVILGSAAFAPVVTATNFGSSPQTNVPVNVSITGPANYTGTATIASLNIASTATATLTTNFNPTVAGTYTLKAWTSLTGDGDPSNDTLTFTFNVTNTAIPIASGNALNFGVGSLARIAEKPVHNPASELTLEAWVNKVTTGFERTIVAKDSALGFIQYELAITTGDSLKLTVLNSSGFHQLFSNILVPAGFNHLAATVSANNIRMYINGRIVMDTVMPTSTFLTFNTDVFVGNNNIATQPLRGQLDELRIWNIARTPTQIRNMMHTRMANGAHANLVGYYRFDEGAGNTFVTDASGNCNTAIFGATAPTWVAVTYPLGQPTVDSAIVNINGTYNMPAVGIELSYTGFVGDDSIHVHRFSGTQLGTSPITTPGGVTTVHPAYWVAYRYGTGTSTATNLKFTLPNGNLNSGVIAADVKLFNRAPNATAGWTLANNTASAASFANQTVEFAQLQSIFGNQLMIGANNNPLPVTLVSFTANASRADAVLRWNTSSEVNSQGFAIERSTDGRIFVEIGFVRSTGNSNRVVNYSFADKNIFAAQRTAYYRLKLVDNNGRYTYTRNVQVTVTNKTTPQVSVYPNPVRDALYVEVDAVNNAAAQINVYDITGKVIKQLAVTLTEGFNKFAIEDVENMNNGVYFISVTANSQVIYTGKIVKTH